PRVPWPTEVSGIASGAGGISPRPYHTAPSSPPVSPRVSSAPCGDSTWRIENESNATDVGVAAAATIKDVRGSTPPTSGSNTLSSENIARPYIPDASSRRSITKLSNTRSIVDSTAHTSRIGGSHQFHDCSDHVALDA